MITLKQYLQDKKKALAMARKKLDTATDSDRVKLADKAGLTIHGLNNYRYGHGKDFETALRIVEG